MMILGLSLSCISCADSIPRLEFQPNPETTIPTDFETYTHEGLFSIAYPSDWDIDLSLIEQVHSLTDEQVNNFVSSGHSNYIMLFRSGKLVDVEKSLAVTVTVGPVAGGVSNIDELAESEIRGLRDSVDSYHEYLRVKTIIDGREAAVVESNTIDGNINVHNLFICTMEDGIVWGVTCGLVSIRESSDFSTFEEDFYSIVRSLRIFE